MGVGCSVKPQHLYIAAPFWDPSPAIREWNTRRVELLADLFRAQGFEPVYVHRQLMDAGVDDDADPAARQAGLDRTCALVRDIAREGGEIRGLTLDSLRCTPGMLVERSAWLSGRVQDEFGWQWATSWKGYWVAMPAGLLEQWRALAVRP